MKRVFKFFLLVYYYISDLINSNILVTYDIITPGAKGNPGVIKLETRCTKDIHIFILSCLIAMTPGSLCFKVSQNRKYIWIHYLYPQYLDNLLDTIRNKYEKLIVEIF
jgi:multicomponent Na+:H+ antiporter subunit E